LVWDFCGLSPHIAVDNCLVPIYILSIPGFSDPMARFRKKIGDDPTITRKEQEIVQSENMPSPKKRKAIAQRKIDNAVEDDSVKKPAARKKGPVEDAKKPPSKKETPLKQGGEKKKAATVAPMEESLGTIITQNVVDEADSQSNVRMDDPRVEEVLLAPMVAMITQNPNSQFTRS
jgi:hypothetical protein